MEQIKISKKCGYKRNESVLLRIASDVNEQIEALSAETGHSKTAIADLLLRKALEVVTIVDEGFLGE